MSDPKSGDTRHNRRPAWKVSKSTVQLRTRCWLRAAHKAWKKRGLFQRRVTLQQVIGERFGLGTTHDKSTLLAVRERVVSIERERRRADFFSVALFVVGLAALLGATAKFSFEGLEVDLTTRVGEFLVAVAITSSLYAASLGFVSSSLSSCLKKATEHQRLTVLEKTIYLSNIDVAMELVNAADYSSSGFLRGALFVAFFGLVYVLALGFVQFGIIGFAVWQLFVHENADWISQTIGLYGIIGALLPLGIYALSDVVTFSYPLPKDVREFAEAPTSQTRLQLQLASAKREARYFALFVKIASKRALKSGRL